MGSFASFCCTDCFEIPSNVLPFWWRGFEIPEPSYTCGVTVYTLRPGRLCCLSIWSWMQEWETMLSDHRSGPCPCSVYSRDCALVASNHINSNTIWNKSKKENTHVKLGKFNPSFFKKYNWLQTNWTEKFNHFIHNFTVANTAHQIQNFWIPSS